MPFITAPLLIFFGLLSVTAHAGYEYKVSYEEQADFQLVEFSGEIMPGLWHPKLNRVLDQIRGEKNIILKVGQSLGGHGRAFNRFAKALKNRCTKKRGEECFVISVFTGICRSSCTQLPLLTDYAVSVSGSRFDFHHNWIIRPTLTIETETHFKQRYQKMGMNAEWLAKKGHRLSRSQAKAFRMSKLEELESGVIDEQLESYEDFLVRFPEIENSLREK